MKYLYDLLYYYFCYVRYGYLKKVLKLEEKYIDIGGQKICLFESKGGEVPIFFIHGFLDAAFGFRKIIHHLDPRFKVYIVDVPGFGRSKLPPVKYLYQLDFFADMIYKTIQKLDLHNLIVCAHSMGGLLTLHMGLKDQAGDKRFQKLILLASGGIPHPKREEMRRILFPQNEADVHNLLHHLYYAQVPDPSPLIRRTLVRAWNKQEFNYLAENTVARENEIFFGEKIKGIKIPTTIIAGKQDQITPPEMMQQMKKYIKNSELMLLDHTRHAIHLEKSPELGHILNSLLEKRA